MSHTPRDCRQLFDTQPAVVAHRGWSGVAPENSLASFRKAAEAGYGIELDVRLAQTGEVMVIHDETVDRTTSGSGRVADQAGEQLQRLDNGSWFGPAFAGERLPSLTQAFEVIPSDCPVLVEMKTDDDKRTLPTAVAQVIEQVRRAATVIVISFDPFMLEAIRHVAPQVLRGQLVGSFEGTDLSEDEKKALQRLAFTEHVQQDLVLWQHDLIDEALVRRMSAAGYPLFAWTVDAPEELARMRALGVAGIVSNHPNRVR